MSNSCHRIASKKNSCHRIASKKNSCHYKNFCTEHIEKIHVTAKIAVFCGTYHKIRYDKIKDIIVSDSAQSIFWCNSFNDPCALVQDE